MSTDHKLYARIVADVPWQFVNWSADAPGQIHNRARGASKHYPTMTLEDIARFAPPVADNAVLFFWTISSHLFASEFIIRNWGFDYKSIAWWWRKTTKDGARSRMGLGYTYRQTGELCLLATRGKIARPAYRSEKADLDAPRPARHSAKPEEQFAKIERVFPDLGPSLEMYGRSRREGWDVFGNEVEGSICIEPLPASKLLYPVWQIR